MKNRKANRMPDYDYSSPGVYFITICSKIRSTEFGSIDNGIMKLNNCGEIVKRQWLWLEEQYKYIKLDEFIIMPDHFHGIVIIKDTDDLRDVLCGDNPGIVPTGNFVHQTNPRHNLLSKTINAFKTTSSKHIHLSGNREFKWQRSFYDRIIRTDEGLNNIRDYIRLNPLNVIDKIW